ncbi:nitroreductase family deazaflavin-dependent oxidoreductase [soil metagenome]
MSASDTNDWNAQVIKEFRENNGKVGGPFEGAPLLLLHHTGAKTGTERVTPLMYEELDGGFAVFASKGGAPTNPDWFHNITTNPEVKVELGDRTVPANARMVEGAERDSIWESWKEEWPQFAEYEQKTDREIPVVLLKAS